jgi:hypothetical protein
VDDQAMSIDRNEPVHITIRGCADDPIRACRRRTRPASWSIASRPFIATT